MHVCVSIIRQEAVPLVDAFDIHDHILNSCLGRYDGDVYTHMYQWAKRAPRNKSKVNYCVDPSSFIILLMQVHPTYFKHLKSILAKSKL